MTVVLFFASWSTTTYQFPSAQVPLSATERGFPLAFQYVYRPADCPVNIRITYCPPPTLSQFNWTNAVFDFIIWFAVSLLVVSLLDIALSKRYFGGEEKQTELPITTTGNR
ncbi:MAG TPA: hypothetical protein VFF30_12860 [Nitrososphaerales archaeon]|nr:hypothetical protein [Nitrososphaerales archaeon]